MEKLIKKSYICKDVNPIIINDQLDPNYKPAAGDVGIFEVLEIGKHKNMQDHQKRNCTIVPGDLIMAAFGTRYATAQFEGYLPENITGELHILGGGGTIGVIASMHERYRHIGPTKLRCVGILTDVEGAVINTKKCKQHAIKKFTGEAASKTKVILSLGSSMDSGKTTSAAYLCHGLAAAGYATAYIKLTGTVYTKDCDLAYDLGANMVADFGDFGYPSTYQCSSQELLNLYESLVAKVLSSKPDFVVMEIADGLYERETKMLIQNQAFCDTVYSVMFSAGDSLAAVNGIETLRKWGIAPQFISGLLTASPLMIKEVKENTELPIYNLKELGSPNIADAIFSTNQLAATYRKVS